MRVLAIAGSLRSGSFNAALLTAAGALLPPDIELVRFDGWRALPPYDEDTDGPRTPPAVTALREALADADALLIATPEYNSSVPGWLKNALDWASRPYPDNVLRSKPIAVVGASTGLFGAIWAQAELRKALRTSGANVLDEELAIGFADRAFDSTGALRDSTQSDALALIIARLIAACAPDARNTTAASTASLPSTSNRPNHPGI